MKAIAVTPGQKNSVHLEDIPRPKVSDIAGGKGVLVRVLKSGSMPPTVKSTTRCMVMPPRETNTS